MRDLSSNEIEHVSGGSAQYSSIPWILDGGSNELTLETITVFGSSGEGTTVNVGLLPGAIIGGIGGFVAGIFNEITEGDGNFEWDDVAASTGAGIIIGLSGGLGAGIGASIASALGLGTTGTSVVIGLGGALTGAIGSGIVHNPGGAGDDENIGQGGYSAVGPFIS